MIFCCNGKSITLKKLEIPSSSNGFNYLTSTSGAAEKVSRNILKKPIVLKSSDCDKFKVEILSKISLESKGTYNDIFWSSLSSAEGETVTTTRSPLDKWCECACLTGEAGTECDCPPPVG